MKKTPSIETTLSNVLTINGGSSSIKFALYRTNEPLTRILYGNIDRIGVPDSKLTFTNEKEKTQDTLTIKTSDYRSAANLLIDWLEKQIDFSCITGIGHRVVHGMHHTSPEIITPELLDELHRITPLDLDHLPAKIELIEVFRQRHPKLMALFDEVRPAIQE